MRSIWRTKSPVLAKWRSASNQALVRDVLAIAVAVAVIGVSFGTIAVSAGLPWWVPPVMSVLVFAGGAQFLSIGVIAAGGSLAAAVLGALVLNSRLMPYGLAVADTIGKGRVSRLVGSHLVTDETMAFALAQPDRTRSRMAFWLCGVLLYLGWVLGTIAGALAGQAIGDPSAFGLDAAFPAALLALVLPSLRDSFVLRSVLLGAAIALAASPFLPPGVPLLLALVGLILVPRKDGVPA